MAITSLAYAHLSGAQKKRLMGAPRRRKPYSIDKRRLYTSGGWPVSSVSGVGEVITLPDEANSGSRESDSAWVDLVGKFLEAGGQVGSAYINAYTQRRIGSGASAQQIAAEIAAANARANAVANGQASMPGGFAAAAPWIAGGAVLLLIAGLAFGRRRR